MTGVSDSLFVKIFEQGGDIQYFFDAIFGFLSRCTDFYEGDINVSRQIIGESYLKWRTIYNNVNGAQNADTYQMAHLDICDEDKSDCQEISNVSSSNSPHNFINSDFIYENATVINSDIHEPAYCTEIEVSTTTDNDMDNIETPSSTDVSNENVSNKISCGPSSISKDPEKLSDSYNGAVTDKYSWSQTISEIDIQIHLPQGITSSSQINVAITSTHLRVDIHAESEPYVNEDFCWKCKSSESMWWLSNGLLVIHLEKNQERWWEKLLISEDALDIKQMDCSRPLDELPEDAQNKVHEMFWNEQQKRLGKPTTDDIRKNDLLKKSWDADGSPFKGTKFDPSLVKFQ